MRRAVLVIVALALLGGGPFAYLYWRDRQKPAVSFRTAVVQRGDLMMSISATGTVEPVEVVDVGAQVAGRIIEFGQDPKNPGKFIDYGTEVEENTVLARLDDELYAADVVQGKAQLEQAKANVAKAKADLNQMKAKLVQAENNWKRAQELGPSRALAATEYDNYAATYETAKATLAVGEATIVQTEKAVMQAEASLNRTKTNLSYCTIKSPVKGKIIARRVNIGQTVVASLSAPSLFLIGKDLTKLQVWVAVNEADIGNIHPGQAVTFTVDAFRGQTFRGTVCKIRLNASMTQNVVTYTVEVDTDNPDGKLLPYLTANVNFEVEKRENVLMVPNAAIRWKPDPDQVTPSLRNEYANSLGRPGFGGQKPSGGPGERDNRHPPATQPGGKDAGHGTGQGRVWVRDGNWVKPINVRTGPSDTTMTEIDAQALKAGDEVIIGEVDAGPTEQSRNPFIPQIGRRR